MTRSCRQKPLLFLRFLASDDSKSLDWPPATAGVGIGVSSVLSSTLSVVPMTFSTMSEAVWIVLPTVSTTFVMPNLERPTPSLGEGV